MHSFLLVIMYTATYGTSAQYVLNWV